MSLCKETPRAYRLNTCADVYIFSDLHFCSLLGDDEGVVFKNVHLETLCHKFAFSGPQNSVVCKYNKATMHKKFSVFS